MRERNLLNFALITFFKRVDSITDFHRKTVHIETSLLIVGHLEAGLPLNFVGCWKL